MEEDNEALLEPYSDEWFIEQNLCHICGESLCSECGNCPNDAHSDDCIIAKELIENVKRQSQQTSTKS